jgi:uncharacterized protein
MTTILVTVKPRSGISELRQTSDGGWQARVKAPPVEGKANEELRKLVARHFGVTKSQVTIRTGKAGRTKLVQIDD